MSKLPSWECGDPLVTLKELDWKFIHLNSQSQWHKPVARIWLVLTARHYGFLRHQISELRRLVGASPRDTASLHNTDKLLGCWPINLSLPTTLKSLKMLSLYQKCHFTTHFTKRETLQYIIKKFNLFPRQTQKILHIELIDIWKSVYTIQTFTLTYHTIQYTPLVIYHIYRHTEKNSLCVGGSLVYMTVSC